MLVDDSRALTSSAIYPGVRQHVAVRKIHALLAYPIGLEANRRLLFPGQPAHQIPGSVTKKTPFLIFPCRSMRSCSARPRHLVALREAAAISSPARREYVPNVAALCGGTRRR